MEKKYKAIFEVEFDPKVMCDELTIKNEYGGSWYRLIKFLYEQEGMGIFDNELKLLRVWKNGGRI